MKKSELFKAVAKETNSTVTTNGMAAYKSTLDANLDLFFQGPACRNQIDNFINYLDAAWSEDPLMALRCLFYFRDIRGNGIGQGERKIFREGLRHIAKINPNIVIKNIKYIPFFGRWDDVISLLNINSKIDEEIKNIVTTQFRMDIDAIKNGKPVSLLGKWLPSCNTSSKNTRELSKQVRHIIFNDMSEKTYRKTLSILRKAIDIIETHLSQKEYNFDYSKIPGKAALKYVKAFCRNDNERYTKYREALAEALRNPEVKSDVKFNAGTLSPADIIKKMYGNINNLFYSQDIAQTNKDIADSAWRSLPNYFGKEKYRNWLAIADNSGSMTMDNGAPLFNAVGMALYIAERNEGIFKDQVISFSNAPKFITVDSSLPLYDRAKKFVEDVHYSTDLMAVFTLLLNTAVKAGISQCDMPEAIVIITDCQFNATDYGGICRNCDKSSFEQIKEMYRQAGYEMPKLVYWNASTCDYANMPITVNDFGVILASGNKPGMFKQILSNAKPDQFMKDILNDERYQVISL